MGVGAVPGGLLRPVQDDTMGRRHSFLARNIPTTMTLPSWPCCFCRTWAGKEAEPVPLSRAAGDMPEVLYAAA